MAHACVRGTVQCSAYDASPQTMSSRPRASQFLRPQRRSAVLRSRASVGVLASYHEEQAKKTVQQRAAEVDNMISKWKKRKEGIDSGNPVMEIAPLTAGPDPRTFRYVYVADPTVQDNFKVLYLRDALETRGINMHVAQLPAASTEWTISSSLAALQAELAAMPGDTPFRLIGTSLGAVIAGQYAAQHPEKVDSAFFMSPMFDLPACFAKAVGGDAGVAEWEKAGVAEVRGARLGWGAMLDARRQDTLPFVRCRTYCVFGLSDGFSDLDTTLNWVRGASVFMRKKGASEERAGERRLLEVADGHDLLDSLPLISAKVVEWFELLGLVKGDFRPSEPLREFETVRPQDVALGHGANFEVYRNWLISQGFDPDDDMK